LSAADAPPSAPLARRPRPVPDSMDLQSFAQAAGLHPDFILRLVALGLLEAGSGSALPGGGSSVATNGGPWFVPAQLAAVARIQRLRSGLALNYAALGLVLDLLDRVAELENELRKRSRATGGTVWTRTG
jgi:chaperone modulatory protein CbpM